MTGGVRAQVEVSSPEDCPVAGASSETNTRIDRVDRASADVDGTVGEEFVVSATAEGEIDASEITSDGTRSVYRFDRDRADPCACDLVEMSGPPVADVRAQDGSLFITFRAQDVSNVRSVIEQLRESYDGVRLQTLSKFDPAEGEDIVPVDRSRLTDKQRDVLERAHELGYFEYPKGANAGEVADDLDIARSTFSEHLSAAQTKLLEAVLDSPTR
ncbi:helix-turn-helix domain-containing protein [Natronoarchaeum sp. GCM10025703]